MSGSLAYHFVWQTSLVMLLLRVITVRDKGYMIAAYGAEDAFRPIYADYRLYTDGHSRGDISVADLQKQIYLQLAKSSKITSVKGGKLSFSFNFGQHKKVPVHLLGTVVPGKNYYLAHVDFVPDSVQVYAANVSILLISPM